MATVKIGEANATQIKMGPDHRYDFFFYFVMVIEYENSEFAKRKRWSTWGK
jgi:hypothetical protein